MSTNEQTNPDQKQVLPNPWFSTPGHAEGIHIIRRFSALCGGLFLSVAFYTLSTVMTEALLRSLSANSMLAIFSKLPFFMPLLAIHFLAMEGLFSFGSSFFSFLSLGFDIPLNWDVSRRRKVLVLSAIFGLVFFGLPAYPALIAKLLRKLSWAKDYRFSIWFSQVILLCAVAIPTTLKIKKLLTRPEQRSEPTTIDLKPQHTCRSQTRAKGVLRIAHLSDLHLSAGSKTLEGDTSPDQTYWSLLQRHAQILRQSHIILITGDITDSGNAAQWKAFFDLTPADLLHRIAILPGNHDINVTNRDYMYVEDAYGVSRSFRLLRVLLACGACQGARAWVLSESGDSLLLNNLLEKHEALFSKMSTHDIFRLRAFASGRASRANTEMEQWVKDVNKLWRTAFPMAVDLGPNNPVLVLLDSNDSSESILGNAFGNIDKSNRGIEYERIDRLLKRKFPSRPSWFALHHQIHLSVKLRSKYHRLQTLAMVLRDATQFYSVLERHAPTMVFHGHRHIGRAFKWKKHGISVFSAPSTTLGDHFTETIRAGFHVFDIRHNRDNPEIIESAFLALTDEATKQRGSVAR